MVKNKRLDINFNQKLISGFLFMKNTMCTLSDAYDKRTEEWKREVFRIRGSLGQERIPGKKGLQSRKMESKVMLPETAGNITEDEKG